jgi:hypothetical protein
MKKYYKIISILFWILFCEINRELFAQGNTFPSTGNVGIGTTIPSRPLHVNGNSTSWTARFQNSNGWVDIGPANNGGAHIYTDRSRFYFNKDIELVGQPSRITAYQNNILMFRTGGNDRLTITPQGNIGISTTEPDNAQGWERVMEMQGNLNAKFLVTTNNSSVKVGIFAHSTWNGPRGIIGTESNHDLSINTGYSQERIRIKNNGNIGIGTTNPTEKLEVNGTIKTKEVNVTLSGWPDYVFDSEYYLIPIEELESFIQKNRHLPGIPSEIEILESGLNVGELQSKLLEKIEELTLYLIAQEKKMAEMKNSINKLEQLLNDVKE